MRVYLDARNITEHPAGVARYAQALIPELVAQRPDWDWVVVRHASNVTPLKADVREVVLDVPIDNAINLVRGAKALDRAFRTHGKPDLYHDLFHVLPMRLPKALRVVVTLHDFVWIDHAHESQTNWKSAMAIEKFARVAIPYALKRADHVICVSEPTRTRAQEYLSNTPSSVVVHGVEARYFDPVPEPNSVIEPLMATGYLVAVGNAKPYKNLRRLLEAFVPIHKAHGTKLCLIGSCDELIPTIQDLGINEHVILPGFLNDTDLRRFVGHARGFVFPSLVEGFGLPTLEAMALGVACAVSNREPMNFVAGDAALKFDPLDVASMTKSMEELVSDDALNDDLCARARTHARKFTWSRAALETLTVYDAVVTRT